jgi:hypothetical protein
MPGATPRGYPFPLSTEPADGSPQIEALARAVDLDTGAIEASLLKGVPIFPNAAARDAAIPAPVAGQVTYLQDIGQQQMYTPGKGWLPSGGVLPSMVVNWGASSLVVGSNSKLNYAPISTAAGGGLVWDAPNSAVTVAAPGFYAVGVSIYFLTTQQNGAFIPAIGNLGAPTLWGGTHTAPVVGGNAHTQLSSILQLAAGDKLAAWYLAGGTGTIGDARMTVRWIGQ